MKHFSLAEMQFVHRDANGNVLFQQGWTQNFLCNEGEKNLLQSYLQNTAHPTSFRIRLFADTPVETDSLASLSGEPGGNTGYVSPTINRDNSANGWPTYDEDAGDSRLATRTMTFRCTGPANYPAISHAVMATSSDNLGLLLDAYPLAQTRALRSGETFDVVYRPKLS